MRNYHAKNNAPDCAFPGCTTKVGAHANGKSYTSNGNTKHKYKTFCNFHRTKGKHLVDAYKQTTGCQNVDGHISGICCTATDLPAESLTIDHIDGDCFNNNEANLQVLCANCHAIKTKLRKDYRSRAARGFDYVKTNFNDLFTFED